MWVEVEWACFDSGTSEVSVKNMPQMTCSPAPTSCKTSLIDT